MQNDFLQELKVDKINMLVSATVKQESALACLFWATGVSSDLSV